MNHTVIEANWLSQSKSFNESNIDKIDNGFSTKNLIMGDEVHFHLTCTVIKQNCRPWAPLGDTSHIICEKPDCIGWC